MNDPFAAPGPRRIVLGLLLGGLLVLAYVVLQLFLVPVAWAAIMAYTTWPLYLRCAGCCPARGFASRHTKDTRRAPCRRRR